MSEKASINWRIEFSATLKLNESELRAFDALVGYGDDAFLKVFREGLGEAYIRNHEAGLRSAFEAIRSQVIPAIQNIDRSRKDLIEAERRRVANRVIANLGAAESPPSSEQEPPS
mgnify:CR=1 FL=1|jgi:hypothetical protein